MYTVEKTIYVDIKTNGTTGIVLAEDVAVDVDFAYDDIDEVFYVYDIYDIERNEAMYTVIHDLVNEWCNLNQQKLFEDMANDDKSYHGVYK